MPYQILAWSLILTIDVTIYFVAKKIFGKPVAILSIFFYTVSVLPIQLAHFYAVDTLLTFFILITLYQLINFYEKQTIKNALLVGVFFGLSLATKTTGTGASGEILPTLPQ